MAEVEAEGREAEVCGKLREQIEVGAREPEAVEGERARLGPGVLERLEEPAEVGPRGRLQAHVHEVTDRRGLAAEQLEERRTIGAIQKVDTFER
jgi:hypothetical protein